MTELKHWGIQWRELEEHGLPLGWESLLSPSELERCERNPQGRLWACWRSWTRLALAESTQQDPKSLVWQLSPSGKPWIQGGPFFNLSHSGAKALLVLGTVPVGIDLQLIESKRPHLALASRYFCPQDVLELTQSECLATDFARKWARKEALSKCLGRPLLGPVLATYVVEGWNTCPEGRVWVQDLTVAEGYCAALALAPEHTGP